MDKAPKKIHRAEVLAEKRQIIESDTQKLLVIQREGQFTFRCVDCLFDPKICLRSFITPCIVNGEIAEELGLQADDVCISCFAPCCTLAQLKNELELDNSEKSKVEKLKEELLGGMEVERK